jgi:hypothetical protein
LLHVGRARNEEKDCDGRHKTRGKKATKKESKKGSMKRQLECLCPEWTIVIGPGRHHHRLTLKDCEQWRQVEREANGGFGTQQRLHMPSNRQAGSRATCVAGFYFQSAPSSERIVSASSSLTPSIDSIQAIDGSVVRNPFVSAIFPRISHLSVKLSALES